MRDLQEKKDLDVRFKRSENNSADIMTKNTTLMFMRNIQRTLEFWMEDVKQDSSVTEFTHSWAFSPESSPASSSLISLFTSESRTPKRSLDKSHSSST
jgi:hypothetical protein